MMARRYSRASRRCKQLGSRPTKPLAQRLAIIHQINLDVAIATGNGTMLSRHLRDLTPLLPAEHLGRQVLTGVADMLDPDGQSELCLKAELRRRRVGNQFNPSKTAWKYRFLAGEVEGEYARRLADGERSWGLRKRVIHDVAERRGVSPQTVRDALKAVTKAFREMEAKLKIARKAARAAAAKLASIRANSGG